MAQRSIHGTAALAEQIRRRRNELGLTIEEAATRAGVGTKTWSRYEAGESIRRDKGKGICKALNWNRLPEEDEDDEGKLSINEYKGGKAWSAFLEEVFGPVAALSFAAGSDLLLDHIREDMKELARMPAGSHIGQLDISLLADDLPEQFLTRYDYEFLYRMKCALLSLRHRARAGLPMTAHSVMEELLIYLCNEAANVLIELCSGIRGPDDEELAYKDDWPFDLFDDMDIITFLYSNFYLEPDHPYHYIHWDKQQFYMDQAKITSQEGEEP